MDYKLLNKIEKVIKACCIGGEGSLTEGWAIPEAVCNTLSYELERALCGVEIGDKDWTLIHANVQSGLAMAASKTMRILGASHDIGVVTHE